MAGNFSFPWRLIFILLIAALLVGGALFFRGPYPTPGEITVDAFKNLLQENQLVVDAEHPLDVYKEQNNRIEHVSGYQRSPAGELVRFDSKIPPEQDSQVLELLFRSGIKFAIKPEYELFPAGAVRFLPYLIFGFVILRLVFRLRRASRARA